MNIKSLVLLTFLGVASLLGLAILIGVFSGRPDAQFSEGRMVTFISGAQFLWAAWLLNRIRQLRHVAPNRSFWKPATAIWGMMALGFIFLAADDMLGVHERQDKLCHSLFKLKEPPITDSLDDLIIGAYALDRIPDDSDRRPHKPRSSP